MVERTLPTLVFHVSLRHLDSRQRRQQEHTVTWHPNFIQIAKKTMVIFRVRPWQQTCGRIPWLPSKCVSLQSLRFSWPADTKWLLDFHWICAFLKQQKRCQRSSVCQARWSPPARSVSLDQWQHLDDVRRMLGCWTQSAAVNGNTHSFLRIIAVYRMGNCAISVMVC